MSLHPQLRSRKHRSPSHGLPPVQHCRFPLLSDHAALRPPPLTLAPVSSWSQCSSWYNCAGYRSPSHTHPHFQGSHRWPDGTWATDWTGYRRCFQRASSLWTSCSWRPCSLEGGWLLEKASWGPGRGGRLHLPQTHGVVVPSAPLLEAGHLHGAGECDPRGGVCQGPTVTGPPITTDIYHTEAVFCIQNCQEDNRECPIVVVEQWARVAWILDDYMLFNCGSQTVRKVPALVGVGRNGSSIFCCWDRYVFLHQAIPYYPGHFCHNAAHCGMPHTIAVRYGAKRIPNYKASVKWERFRCYR